MDESMYYIISEDNFIIAYNYKLMFSVLAHANGFCHDMQADQKSVPLVPLVYATPCVSLPKKLTAYLFNAKKNKCRKDF